MLYYLLRVLICGATAVFTVLKVNHSKLVKKKFYSVLIVVVFIIAVTVSTIFPPENCFMNFRTSEAVCQYSVIGKICTIVEGEESAFAVYQTGPSTYSTCIIPKTFSGYKIPTAFSAEKISQKINDRGIITTFRAKKTNDYYIIAMIQNEDNKSLQVFDFSGNPIEGQSIILGNTDVACVYLQSFSKEYFILIDGEKVQLG